MDKLNMTQDNRHTRPSKPWNKTLDTLKTYNRSRSASPRVQVRTRDRNQGMYFIKQPNTHVSDNPLSDRSRISRNDEKTVFQRPRSNSHGSSPLAPPQPLKSILKKTPSYDQNMNRFQGAQYEAWTVVDIQSLDSKINNKNLAKGDNLLEQGFGAPSFKRSYAQLNQQKKHTQYFDDVHNMQSLQHLQGPQSPQRPKSSLEFYTPVASQSLQGHHGGRRSSLPIGSDPFETVMQGLGRMSLGDQTSDDKTDSSPKTIPVPIASRAGGQNSRLYDRVSQSLPNTPCLSQGSDHFEIMTQGLGRVSDGVHQSEDNVDSGKTNSSPKVINVSGLQRAGARNGQGLGQVSDGVHQSEENVDSGKTNTSPKVIHVSGLQRVGARNGQGLGQVSDGVHQSEDNADSGKTNTCPKVIHVSGLQRAGARRGQGVGIQYMQNRLCGRVSQSLPTSPCPSPCGQHRVVKHVHWDVLDPAPSPRISCRGSFYYLH